MTTAFIKMEKLKKHGIIEMAARHNLREIKAETLPDSHIDATKSHLNEVLLGPCSAGSVSAAAKLRMAAAGVLKLRRDAVRGIELLISLPAQHSAANGAFFADCVRWTANRYGRDNILSAVVHRDEAAPHLHILLLPLVNGKMNGSDMMGNLATIAQMQQTFHKEVGQRYGLREPSARTSAKVKERSYRLVMATLERNQDPLLKSSLLPIMRDWIRKNPQTCCERLGIEPPSPKPKSRTMAQIFTSKGKGPRVERVAGRPHF